MRQVQYTYLFCICVFTLMARAQMPTGPQKHDVTEKIDFELLKKSVLPKQDSSGLWGYADIKGKWVIEPIYQSADKIVVEGDPKNAELGDSTGSIYSLDNYIETQGDEVRKSHLLKDGRIRFYVNVSYADKVNVPYKFGQELLIGLLDRSGRLIVAPKYELLEKTTWGALACLPEYSIQNPFQYAFDSALSLLGGIGGVASRTEYRKSCGAIDINGKTRIPFVYESITQKIAGYFGDPIWDEAMAKAEILQVEKDRLKGLIRANGSAITKIEYLDIGWNSKMNGWEAQKENQIFLIDPKDFSIKEIKASKKGKAK